MQQLTNGVFPTPDEMAEAQRWVGAKFKGITDTEAPEAGLIVLANNDAVQKNARMGKPLKIADKQYHRGLYCHAVSKVVVRLPGAGETFTAEVGVDSNEQTQPGRGSVVFSVNVGDRELFCSEVMREGMCAVPVEIALGGATEFTLEVGDAGDGISCDQADWADAKVILEDGHIIWLGDMEMEGTHRAEYTTELLFSFTYGGQSSAELLKDWELKRNTQHLNAQHTEHTLTYTDTKTGLVVRCVAVEYHDFPTVEWTLYFKNTNSEDAPILADIQSLDTRLERHSWPETELTEFLLHHHVGSPCTPTDYQPLETKLRPNENLRFAPPGGRPSDSVLPYFNLEWPSEGVIIVVGWPGQWAAEFTRDEGIGLRIRAGQELTSFRLHPGEEVRTPLIVMQFWKGDRIQAQNIWRRWMFAHNLPCPGGKPLAPQMAACSSHQYGEMIHANEENQKMFVDRYLEQGLKLDYWWMDAGWYVNETGWPNTGTWEVDTKRFPRGLRNIVDHAHDRGVRSIVWFEPERVTPGTWLYEEHPEWLLGRDGETKLLNLGNPEVRQWLTEHVDNLIREQKIDLYRNDFNINPLSYWRANDADDRQGISEIKYVTGFLTYWDELRRRYPNMLIDTCASGGRRNDLETLRRSVPLLRSDYILEPVSQQNHTYGIAPWIPFYGTGVNSFDAYVFRSQICPHITACYDMRNENQDFETLRRLYKQWLDISPYYFGDFYPLIPYNPDNDVWMAWQFDRPDLGEGMVQVFRRTDSIYEAARLKLRGLNPNARYAVTNLDSPDEKRNFTGSELMEKGIPVAVKEQPGAVIITYKRAELESK